MGDTPCRANTLGVHHRNSSRTPPVVRQPISPALSRMSSPREEGTPTVPPPIPPPLLGIPSPSPGDLAWEAAAAAGTDEASPAEKEEAEVDPPAWEAGQEEGRSRENRAARTAGSADARQEHT